MKTVLDIYRALLHDLNKEEAPAMYPSDFEHFLNKAVNQVVNKFFNSHDVNIQATDNLRSLVATVRINGQTGVAVDSEGNALESYPTATPNDTDLGRMFLLPLDYYHMRNCWATIRTSKKDCDGNQKEITTRVKRLTADMWQSIIEDYFQKPSSKRPYYYIQKDKVEIRWGFDGELVGLSFDYLKTPTKFALTPEHISIFESTGEDTTAKTGFSSYVNYEILREINMLVFGRDMDPRLQTAPTIMQSIPN